MHHAPADTCVLVPFAAAAAGTNVLPAPLHGQIAATSFAAFAAGSYFVCFHPLAFAVELVTYPLPSAVPAAEAADISSVPLSAATAAHLAPADMCCQCCCALDL